MWKSNNPLRVERKGLSDFYWLKTHPVSSVTPSPGSREPVRRDTVSLAERDGTLATVRISCIKLKRGEMKERGNRRCKKEVIHTKETLTYCTDLDVIWNIGYLSGHLFIFIFYPDKTLWLFPPLIIIITSLLQSTTGRRPPPIQRGLCPKSPRCWAGGLVTAVYTFGQCCLYEWRCCPTPV